jgi:hypothetical protein
LATRSFSFGAYGSDMVHESISDLWGGHVSCHKRRGSACCKKNVDNTADCRTNVVVLATTKDSSCTNRRRAHHSSGSYI